MATTSSAAAGWRLAWTWARRDLRGGLKGLRVLIACLALGVFAIAAAGSTRTAVRAGIEADAQALLGGDLDIAINYRAPNAGELAAISALGTVARLREMGAMAHAGQGEALRTVMVDIKTAGEGYPLYGRLETTPAAPLPALLTRDGADGPWGAVADPGLASRLNIQVGEVFQVGQARFVLRAVIAREPDRVASRFTLGQRLMIADPALEATGLLLPGALVRHLVKVKLPPDADPAAAAKALDARFPDAGWRIRTPEEAAPAAERFLDNVALFLTLVGLTSLLVGGVGVANAIAAFVEGRVETVAVMKTMGAPAGLVFRVFLLEIALLSLLGVAIGLAVGALAPWAVAAAADGLLPAAVKVGLYPGALLTAAAFGLLTALAFGLWPLARTYAIPAATLFRGLVAPATPGWRSGIGGRVLGGLIAAGLALAALTILSAEQRGLAAGFVVGSALALLLFRAVAGLITATARRVPAGGRPRLRLALANLYRPGAPTASVVLSLGLGLSVLVTIALIEGNMRRQISEKLPETAPAFYAIDLQPDQRDPFVQAVEAVPGVKVIGLADMVRGRVVALNGQPVVVENVAPDSRWAVQGDRGLSTAAALPEGTELSAGTWWAADYQGPPLLSLASGIAKGLGVGVGDTVTLNVLGRDIVGTVASLREVEWSTLAMNFAFVVSPGSLDGAPRTWIATVSAPPEAEDAVERAVVSGLPNVSLIRVRQALDGVRGMLEAAGLAVRATAAVTLLAGALVLTAAVAAGHRRRVYEAVVLKVLGAVRRDVLRAYLLEYGLLGAATGILAAGVGAAASWAVLRLVMRADWAFLPGTVAVTVVGCVALTLAGGYIGTGRALAAKAAPHLREE